MSVNIIQYPQRIIDNNNLLISKWTAINHSVSFKMKREDDQCNFFYVTATQIMTVLVSTGISQTTLPGDTVYLEGTNGQYDTFTVANVFVNALQMEPQAISGPFGSSGFMNYNSRKNYFVLTNVYGLNESFQYILIGQSINKPDAKGVVSVDVSSFLKNIVGYQDNFKYDVLNEKDGTLGSPFNITYSENWQNFEGPFSGLSNTVLRFGVNAAKQIQDLYGQNMGEYVPFFIDAITPVPYAKFLSDFKEPTYFPGFPFSLSFIYSEYLVGIETYKHQENFDINGNSISVLTPLLLAVNEAQEVNRLLIDYNVLNYCSEVWLESDGTQDCLQAVVLGYVAPGFFESICGLPVAIPPGPGRASSQINTGFIPPINDIPEGPGGNF